MVGPVFAMVGLLVAELGKCLVTQGAPVSEQTRLVGSDLAHQGVDLNPLRCRIGLRLLFACGDEVAHPVIGEHRPHLLVHREKVPQDDPEPQVDMEDEQPAGDVIVQQQPLVHRDIGIEPTAHPCRGHFLDDMGMIGKPPLMHGL